MRDLDTSQRQFLSTAGLIYLSLLDSPDATDDQRAAGFLHLETIIRAARIAGFDDAVIAGATGMPIFLVCGVAA